MNVDEAALLAAYDIEDIMCQHHEGGRIQRLARIQCAVVTAFGRVGQKPPASTGLQANPIKHPSAQVAATLTPVSDQPTDAALPPSVETAAPPAVEFAPLPQQAPKPVLIPKAAAKPKSKPLDPRPGCLAGTIETHKGSVVTLDMINNVVVCPKGHWQVTPDMAAVFLHMQNGDLFNAAALAKIANMPLASFNGSIWRWQEELAKRGIRLESGDAGCRIEVAK